MYCLTSCCVGIESFEKKLPSMEEWTSSKYKVDEKEHSGRLICVIDLLSVGWQFAKEIYKIASETLVGLGALLLSVILIPAAKITTWIASYNKVPNPNGEVDNRTASEKRVQSWEKNVTEKALHQLYRVPIDLALFFVYFAPRQIVKMGGNALGIAVPEIGRFVRQNVNTSNDVVPKYEDWRDSKYALDQEDHLGRAICLIDIFSGVWHVAGKILEIAGTFFIGVTAVVASFFLVLASFIKKCASQKEQTMDDAPTGLEMWKTNAVHAIGSNFSGLLLLTEFLLFTVPKVILKTLGNTIGIFIPEVGRWVRTCDLLKLSNSSSEAPPKKPDVSPGPGSSPDAAPMDAPPAAGSTASGGAAVSYHVQEHH